MAINLKNSACAFRRQYKIDDVNSSFYNPAALYSYIRNCVMIEKRILGWSNENSDNFAFDSELSRTINRVHRIISETRSSVSHHKSNFQNIKSEYDQFNISLQIFQASPLNGDEIYVKQQRFSLETLFKQIKTNRSRFVDSILTILNNTKSALAEIIDEHLTKWRIDQRLAGNGLRSSTAISIDIIRTWCQSYADIICNLRENTKHVQSLQLIGQHMNDDPVPQLLEEITKILVYLITRTVIVEKQPPQVLKTKLK